MSGSDTGLALVEPSVCTEVHVWYGCSAMFVVSPSVSVMTVTASVTWCRCLILLLTSAVTSVVSVVMSSSGSLAEMTVTCPFDGTFLALLTPVSLMTFPECMAESPLIVPMTVPSVGAELSSLVAAVDGTRGGCHCSNVESAV